MDSGADFDTVTASLARDAANRALTCDISNQTMYSAYVDAYIKLVSRVKVADHA